MKNLKSHIVLFTSSLQPVANFVVVNVDDQAFVLERTLIYFLAILSLAYLLWCFGRLVLKSKDALFISLAAASAILLLFNFHLTEPLLINLLNNFTSRPGRFIYIAPLHLTLFFGSLILISKIALSKNLSNIAVSILFFFTLVDVFLAGPMLISSSNIQQDASNFELNEAKRESSHSIESTTKPNVYLIIPDGMPAKETVEATTGGYTYKITKTLENKGFVLVDNSISNGMITLTSVPHLLSMNYFLSDNEIIKPEKKSAMLKVFMGSNAVVSEFRRRGYKYFQVNGAYHVTRCSGYEDFCIGKTTALTELDLLFLRRTMIFKFASRVDSLQEIFDLQDLEIPDIANLLPKKDEGPFFLQAHFSMPHMPFRFNSNCKRYKFTERPYPYEPNLSKWQTSFKEQLICAELQLEEFVDSILASDPEAIIILQSDHGSAHAGYIGKSQFEFSNREINIARGIYSAFLLPKKCEGQLRPGLSPVNTFRVIFACLDDKPADLLEDVTYAVDPSETIVRRIN